MQEVDGEPHFVRLQAPAHGLAGLQRLPGPGDGPQLPPAGQQERYGHVHGQLGPAEPQDLEGQSTGRLEESSNRTS